MGRPKKEEDLGPEADENWKSKDPKALAYEIATFMGGSWPTRPVRKVQLSLDGVPSVRTPPAAAAFVRYPLPAACNRQGAGFPCSPAIVFIRVIVRPSLLIWHGIRPSRSANG